jgi:dihydropteroate synthase
MTVSLMGVLNITPDSFSNDGFLSSNRDILEVAQELRADGAGWIDVGAVSTRPGSNPISIEEEWERLSPFIAAIASQGATSVDTYQSEVARKSCKLGIKMINDISGASNIHMLEVAAEEKVALVAMYSSSNRPHKFSKIGADVVVDEVLRFFENVVKRAKNIGILTENLYLDPGMGAFLSPDGECSIAVLRALDRLLSFFPRIVLGISRKGFLRSFRVNPKINLSDSFDTESVCVSIATLLSSKLAWLPENEVLLRVHDVRNHATALSITTSFLSEKS